jgi:O-antigen/teichoic acid export membrane protein
VRPLILRGISWKVSSQIVVQIARIGFALTLARLLQPRDFGLAGMALVIAALVTAFSDLGLGAALVQRRTIDDDDTSTVFWTSLAAGAFLTVAGLALAGPVASFYGEPRVRGLMAAMSLCFVITAIGATQRALLTREMDFRRLELRTIIGVVVGGAAGATAAVAGWGPWALVLQQLTTAVISTAVLWFAVPWRPRFVFSRRSLRSLGGYGGNVLGVRLAFYLWDGSLPVIVGRFLGAGALGIFTIAYTVILAPLTRLSLPIGEVLFPAFSRMQDDRERLARIWLRALRVLAAICVPAMVGLVVVAPDFVSVVLGAKWHAAVSIIQVLAWVGLLQALQAWNGAILTGLGRAGTLFRATLAYLFLYVGSFLVGLHWGMHGVVTAYAISSTILEASYLLLTTRALGVSFVAPLRAVGRVSLAAAGMGVAIELMRSLLVREGVPPAIRLAAVVVAGTLIFAWLCAWWVPGVVSEVGALRRGRGAVPAPEGSG